MPNRTQLYFSSHLGMFKMKIQLGSGLLAWLFFFYIVSTFNWIEEGIFTRVPAVLLAIALILAPILVRQWRTACVMTAVEEGKFKALLKGTISVTTCFSKPFILLVIPDKRIPAFDNNYRQYKNYFALHVENTDANFTAQICGKVHTLKGFVTKKLKSALGIDSGFQQTYWLSYDRDSMVIKYGKGYAMNETTLMTFSFSQETLKDQFEELRSEMNILFAIDDEKTCEDGCILLYKNLKDEIRGVCAAGYISKEPLIKVSKEPLTINPSHIILDVDKATFSHLESKDHILSSQLPPICLKIFSTIRTFELEPLLIDQIRHSILTEGCCLNKILARKVYLRITIGEEMGVSPGCPFVLEIWPKGASSPIHNHGACCAIVKVLHGEINCRIFNKVTSPPLPEQPQPLMEFKARQGEFTWMNEQWYQSHQLTNSSADFCATLQCYEYNTKDNIHWNKFDYIKEDELLGFQPGSDLTFHKMEKLVREEWDIRKDSEAFPPTPTSSPSSSPFSERKCNGNFFNFNFLKGSGLSGIPFPVPEISARETPEQ